MEWNRRRLVFVSYASTKLFVLILKRAVRNYAVVQVRSVRLSSSTSVMEFISCVADVLFLSPAIRKFVVVTDCEKVRLGIKQKLTVCSILCDFKRMKSSEFFLW